MAVFYLVALLICSFILPAITGYDIHELSLTETLQPLSLKHPFGTDELGRDLFIRVIYGARVSLIVAIGAQLISFSIGVIMGMLSGFYNERLPDKVISFIMASFHGFPFLLFVLALTAAIGPGIYKIMVAIGVVNWVGIARIIRGEVMMHRQRPYVLASMALGYSPPSILFKQILPNVIPPALIALIFGIGDVIAVESGLSFLGMGVQPPTPSWGKMIFVGKDYITTAWWLSVFPGIFLILTILSFNLLGRHYGEHKYY